MQNKASGSDYDAEATYLNEIVKGTKSNFLRRLLTFTIITRIILSISWVIFAQNLNMISRLSIYVVIQIVFTITTILIRHYEKASDNIIQILNDLVYFFAWIILFRYNTNENWSDGIITALFATITINGLIIVLIQVYTLFNALCNLRSKKRKVINENKIPGILKKGLFNLTWI